MLERTVRARLGPPGSVNIDGNHHNWVSQLLYGRRQPAQQLIITFDTHLRGDPVAFMQASAGTFRTAGGVGVGSTRQAVHRAFPHLKAQYGSYLGKQGPFFMSFSFVKGRVVLINLADTRLRTH